jgi:hypothetical protein
MLAGERRMARGVPVLCQHHGAGLFHARIYACHNLVPARDRQRATGAKVVLHVDHDQSVVHGAALCAFCKG